MFGLRIGEILMLVIIIAIVFSAARMGALGNAIGKFVYSFRRASSGHDQIDVTPHKQLKRADTDATIEHDSKTPKA